MRSRRDKLATLSLTLPILALLLLAAGCICGALGLDKKIVYMCLAVSYICLAVNILVLASRYEKYYRKHYDEVRKE